MLKIDHTSPVKLLEESSDEKNKRLSPESPGLKAKILEEAKQQNRPSPIKKSNKFSPSKPQYLRKSKKARIGDSSGSDDDGVGFRLQKVANDGALL